MKWIASLASLLVCVSARPVLPVPEFKIDLDLDPEERFKEVMEHFAPVLADLWKNLDSSILSSIIDKIVAERGPENDELMGELRGYAKYSSLPLKAYQAANLLYELQTVMVPFENITWPWGQTTRHTGMEPSFGCTGIIARSTDNGQVTHGRNLDFMFAKYLGNMTYNAVFCKGGQELYTAQMIAGYSNFLTGIRRGKNGYTFEINTRYPPKSWNIDNLWHNLFKEKRTLSGWIRRQIFETIDNFEDAVQAMSTKPYASTEYDIISGVQKGVILARNPDDLYHKQVLGPNKNDYIIMTNFDFWDHDKKEWLDPTSIHFGHSRRVGAERILNASNDINADELYKILNDDEVVAKDTIFQALMNVEADSYKSYLPNCEDCSGCADHGTCLKDKATGCCEERTHYTLNCGGILGGGYRCGCLADGACRSGYFNGTRGDEDCCSFTSHFTLDCPGSMRRCGPKKSQSVTIV